MDISDCHLLGRNANQNQDQCIEIRCCGISSQTWSSRKDGPVSSSSGGDALDPPKCRNSAPAAYVQFREVLEQGPHKGFFSSHFSFRCLQVRLYKSSAPERATVNNRWKSPAKARPHIPKTYSNGLLKSIYRNF